jgi:AraC family transcriptional regulator
MTRQSFIEPETRNPAAPESRLLAQGKGWRISEYLCHAGPEDKAFEEQHDCTAIAAVVSGTFNYRTGAGTDTLHPGSFLLGNSGTCYQCGHEHSRGDRCVSLKIEPHYFEEIASSAAGASDYRFPVAMIPAMTEALPHAARFEALAAAAVEAAAIEEAVPQLIETVLGIVSGLKPLPVYPSARDGKRVSDALYYIEQNSQEVLDLDGLAAQAGMSKYHFLRTFRRVVGMAPYQYLLTARLRKVAVRLATSAAPVANIAFEEGFGDLSTFYRRFRGVFGTPPQTFRRNAGPL